MKDTKINIIVDYKKILPFVLDRKKLEKDILTILNITKSGLLEIKLTNDKEMERLNRDFLNLYGPTNVLSFPSGEENFLGSICISLDTIAREGFLYQQDVEKYFYTMLIHGILHLSGYEHGETMELTTENILETLFGEM